MKKKRIYLTEDSSIMELSDTLEDVIQEFQALLMETPKEHESKVMIDFHPMDDYCSFSVYYDLPLSEEEERLKRIKDIKNKITENGKYLDYHTSSKERCERELASLKEQLAKESK